MFILCNFRLGVSFYNRFLPGFALLALNDVLMGVVFVQRRDNSANGEDARTTPLIPPLIAAPQLLFLAILS